MTREQLAAAQTCLHARERCMDSGSYGEVNSMEKQLPWGLPRYLS